MIIGSPRTVSAKALARDIVKLNTAPEVSEFLNALGHELLSNYGGCTGVERVLMYNKDGIDSVARAAFDTLGGRE